MRSSLRPVAFICRSCRQASRRELSTTPDKQKRGVVPDFAPTSNATLDAIFADYREKVFIPESLSEFHKRLIYRPTRQNVLTNEPGVTVSISDEEEVQLKPMKLTERPVLRKTLITVASILRDTDDPAVWQNVYPFLQGLKASGQPAHQSFLEKLVRYANRNGTHQTFMECLEHPNSTGVLLTNPYITHQLFWGCHKRAIAADYKGKPLTEALNLTERLTSMMEKDTHCRASSYPEGHYDMRQSLFVHAVILELHAASGHNLSEIKNAVKRVLALSQHPDTRAPELFFPEFTSIIKNESSFGLQVNRIRSLLPLWSGMKFASKVPGAIQKSDKAAFDTRLSEVYKELQSTWRKCNELSIVEQSSELMSAIEAIEKIHGPIRES